MVSEALKGVFRSLRIYHGDPLQRARMDALYRRLVAPGDLVFDVGSHVGDRVSSFRRLGARVVAVEPQPLALRVLRLLHGRDSNVVIEAAACASSEGSVELRINSANPTISTASRAFRQAAQAADGWQDQYWDQQLRVETTTLDSLIEQHGNPDFIKIDVEGYELEVLRGLTTAPPALSFEFTTIQREVAVSCIERLCELSRYRFNIAIGESQKLEFDWPVDGARICAYLIGLPQSANSGDVYAMRADNE